jgi:tRNA(Arg) A34 adenosine deaminase TadA
MNDEDYMKLAIEEAKKSKTNDGAPIGSILVMGGNVIAVGHSLVWAKKDPSAHNDIECMRAACLKLEQLDLSGCTLYSTLEPCSMCLGCAGWCNITRIVFGAYQEDVPDNPYELWNYHAEEDATRLQLPNGNVAEAKGGVLREECKSLMDGVHNWQSINLPMS